MTRFTALGAALALVLTGAAQAQPKAGEKPQYGGALSVANVYYTISPLTFDSVDWAWKFNQDTGLAYEQLFVADMSKAKRNGGKHAFITDGWLPPDGIKGELAESWKLLENPLRLEIQLRKGVMFPAKAGVMEARELVADDVVYSFDRVNKSGKKIPTYFDHITKVEATGKHTVLMSFNTFNAEWDYRWGWGYYSAIVPKEVMESGAKD